ncbi:MAG: efflux transporter outer membrane subunit [Burkholderiaceae bacterium]
MSSLQASFSRARRTLPPLAAVALATVLLLAGCATPMSASTPSAAVAVPDRWSASPSGSDAVSLQDWWRRFGDETLVGLVAEALDANTDLQSARAALRQARASLDVTRAGAGPSVGAGLSAQRSKSGESAAGNRFQAGFDASWEPDIFGASRAAIDASAADVRASESGLAHTRVSLAAEVAVGYIELRSLQQRLAIASRNLALQQETAQITRWRVQAGLASSLDQEQAVTALEQTQAQIPALQASVSQSIHALSVLTGQPPAALQARLEDARPIPRPPQTLAVSLPAETLRQRPDVDAAARQIEAALARRRAADAARYPSLQLSGSLGLSALTLGGLGSGATVANALLASLSVPLFDGGAARARVDVQDAALEQAALAYRGAVLTALQDVEDALVALTADRERLARLQAAAEAADRAELLARQRYTSGLIDFSSVLETQRSLLSVQDSVATVQASLSADHVRLYKALGGGWQPDAAASTDAARKPQASSTKP